MIPSNGDQQDAGILRIVIEYNPINGQISYNSNSPNDLVIMGMFELAKSALIQRQLAANRDGPRLVVPAPPRIT